MNATIEGYIELPENREEATTNFLWAGGLAKFTLELVSRIALAAKGEKGN